MKRNKGFTLIELIVTVIILAISATLIVGSLSTVYMKNMQQCAVETNALLSRCRISAMSRAGSVYLELRQESDGIYAAYCESDGAGNVSREEERIGKSMLSVSWTDSAGVSHSLSGGALYLAFDRGTGALLPLAQSFAMAGETDPSADCTGIIVSYGDVHRTVVLVPVTGKHYITAD